MMSFEEYITQKARLDEELYKVEEKIAALRARAEKSTASLSLAPGGNAYNDSRLEDLVIRIADLQAEEQRLLREMDGVSAELTAFFSNLDDPGQMKVLILRYVDLKTVEEIMKELDRSRNYVAEKRRKGLAAAEMLYQENCLSKSTSKVHSVVLAST